MLENTNNIVFTHDLPIPDCFNKALDYKEDVWIVEEDVLVAPDTLQKLIDADVDIATANYPLPGGIRCVKEHGSGLIYGGTGCTLIKRRVFDKIGGFRTNISWYADKLEYWESTGVSYGKHDIDFYLRAQMAGFTVGVVGEVKHLRVKEKGPERNNEGWHQVIEL